MPEASAAPKAVPTPGNVEPHEAPVISAITNSAIFRLSGALSGFFLHSMAFSSQYSKEEIATPHIVV